jgi:hypothetical protein
MEVARAERGGIALAQVVCRMDAMLAGGVPPPASRDTSVARSRSRNSVLADFSSPMVLMGRPA